MINKLLESQYTVEDREILPIFALLTMNSLQQTASKTFGKAKRQHSHRQQCITLIIILKINNDWIIILTLILTNIQNPSAFKFSYSPTAIFSLSSVSPTIQARLCQSMEFGIPIIIQFNEHTKMANPKSQPLLIILLLALLLVLSSASPASILTENYDDGSEMNRQIIRDYLSGEQCVRRCRAYSEAALLDSFELFRAAWVEQMVNFVIGELDLDAESARSIRKNPASYMINYDTFKLLAFR